MALSPGQLLTNCTGESDEIRVAFVDLVANKTTELERKVDASDDHRQKVERMVAMKQKLADEEFAADLVSKNMAGSRLVAVPLDAKSLKQGLPKLLRMS